MPARSTTHGSFTIERTLKAPLAAVFQAFADREAKQAQRCRWNRGKCLSGDHIHAAPECGGNRQIGGSGTGDNSGSDSGGHLQECSRSTTRRA